MHRFQKYLERCYKIIKRVLPSKKYPRFNINQWELNRDYLKIPKSVIIDTSASLKICNPSCEHKIYLEIGEKSHIFANFNLLRKQARIKIGKRCHIGNVNFNCAETIEIGDDVLIAWGVTIIDNNSHPIDWVFRRDDVEQSRRDYLLDKDNIVKNKDWSHVDCKKIIIGDRVWIGFNSLILKGVKIGNNAVIGAGSVVTRDVPPYSVCAGNPIRLIKKLEKQ